MENALRSGNHDSVRVLEVRHSSPCCACLKSIKDDDVPSCACVIGIHQEWEVVYRIIRARRLHDLASKLSHSKQSSSQTQVQQRGMGACLTERVDRGEALPEVKLEEQKSKRGRDGDDQALQWNVVEYVMGSMKAELMEELKEVLW